MIILRDRASHEQPISISIVAKVLCWNVELDFVFLRLVHYTPPVAPGDIDRCALRIAPKPRPALGQYRARQRLAVQQTHS
jgi:hypothetical protein